MKCKCEREMKWVADPAGYSIYWCTTCGRLLESGPKDEVIWSESVYEDDIKSLDKVTRFEVIDWNGRQYVEHNISVTLSYQDDGRTLKVFVNRDEQDFIDDGFGTTWSKKCPECGKDSMVIIRPGKAQCNNCG